MDEIEGGNEGGHKGAMDDTQGGNEGGRGGPTLHGLSNP